MQRQTFLLQLLDLDQLGVQELLELGLFLFDLFELVGRVAQLDS